jgi:NADH-quinone oxidoreductase subunit A
MLARTAFVDMSAFYVILLVGFAYVWYRGDLDWVRAVADQRAKASEGKV